MDHAPALKYSNVLLLTLNAQSVGENRKQCGISQELVNLKNKKKE